jgi:hypothetical protein
MRSMVEGARATKLIIFGRAVVLLSCRLSDSSRNFGRKIVPVAAIDTPDRITAIGFAWFNPPTYSLIRPLVRRHLSQWLTLL